MLEQGFVLVSLKYLVFQVSETDGAGLTFCLSLAVEFAAFEKNKRVSLNEKEFCYFKIWQIL